MDEITTTKKKYVFGLIVIMTFVGIFILNRLYPYCADDYGRLIGMSEICKKGNFVFYLQSVAHSLYQYYFTWGARVVAQVFMSLLLSLTPFVNSLSNSIVYVCFVGIIYRICRTKTDSKYSVSVFILINILIFALQPVLGETLLWKTGAANYLWTTTVLLAFLLPFKNYFFESEKVGKTKLSNYKFIYLFIGGIIAGWTNENTVPAVLLLLIVGICCMKKQKRPIPLWVYSGTLGFLIGCVLLVSSPGNGLRTATTAIGVSHYSFIQKFAMQIMKMVIRFLTYDLSAVFIFLVLLLVDRKQNGKFGSKSISFAAIGLLSVLSMSFSPVYPARACFGSITFFILAIVSLYMGLKDKSKLIFLLKKPLLIVATCCFVMYYVAGCFDIYNTSKILKKREKQIVELRKRGIQTIEFKQEIKQYTKLNNIDELGFDPDYWVNESYAAYYHIDSVRIIPQELN